MSLALESHTDYGELYLSRLSYNNEQNLSSRQGHLCSECGKTFKTIHLLASHQVLHKSEKPFACDQCPSRFKWKVGLTCHMVVHTDQRKHVCDTCKATFTLRSSLKSHMSKYNSSSHIIPVSCNSVIHRIVSFS